MLPQNRNEKNESSVKEFYEKPVFEEALRTKPEKIARYLTNEEEFLLGRVKNGAAIAELGCGDGRIVSLLGKYSDKIIGLDFSHYYVSKAKEKAPCSGIVRGDATNTPLKDESFDYALFMFNTLGNLNREIQALNEAKRIIKPEGSILFSVYSKKALPEQLGMYAALGLNVREVTADTVYTEEGLQSKALFDAGAEITGKSRWAFRRNKTAHANLIYRGA
ncbi:Ubiquinone/menaquinone biosynthesis C-methyltransferase UbiE [uncultured archaeon]|nr:Ubiquinone/menaquinone biosynthesis C-methyltransferase UbiE [uncultured archaeon]